MKTQMIAVVASFALAGAAFGAEIKSNTTGDANSTTYDCFRYGQYVKSGGTTVLLWMDGNPPTAENDYSIGGGIINTPNYTTPATNFVFQGGSLTLANGTLGIYTRSPSSVEFPASIGGLQMKDGADLRSRSSSGETSFIKGLVDVKATSSNPGTIRSTGTGTNMATLQFDAKLIGLSSAFLSINRYTSTGYPGNTRMALHGDCSEYFGTIRVNGYTNRLRIASATFPGTVKLVGPCRFESVGTAVSVTTLTESDDKGDDISIAPTSTLTVANLTLKDKSTMYYEFAKDSAGAGLVGSLVVTESLTIDAGAKIAVDVSAFKAGADILTQSSYAVIKVPTAKGTLSADNFDLVMPAATSAVIGSSSTKGTGRLPNWTHEVTTVDDPVLGECSALVVRQVPVILRIKGQAASDDPNDATAWSDSQAVHADADYLIPYESSQFAPWGDKASNFFKGPAGLVFTSAYSTFGGRSLTSQCKIYLETSSVRIDDLTMLGGQNYSGAASCLYASDKTVTPHTFSGDILRVYTSGTAATVGSWGAKSVCLIAGEGCTLKVNAPIAGTGNLTIEYPRQDNTNNTSKLGGVVQMQGDNSQFTGNLRISDMLSDNSFSEDKVVREPNVTLRVSDENQLGCKMASFSYYGLFLSRWGCLENVGDLTLSSDESNRGLYVEGYGHIRTPEGTTLTMNKRLTMAGELYKSGKGVLLLGSDTAPTFTSKQSAWPDALEGTNVVTVAEGAFGAATRAASAGLAVTFTETGSLLVDANATGDQATYGYDASAAGSSVTGIDGKIPVSFDVAGKTCGEELSGVICTVAANSSLTTDSFVLAEPKPFGAGTARYMLKVTQAADEDGNKVFTATAAPYGTFIFFR